MNVNNKTREFVISLTYAFAAQGTSLVLSILMSLIVPKMLGVEEFGYWQLFIFYSSYVGFFHLGLNDGIYLRYGGINYNSIDFSLIGSQFWLSIIGQLVLSLLVFIYTYLFVEDHLRVFVIVSSLFYMVFVNASGYLGFVFQAANKTKTFSTSVMIDKLFFTIFVLILLFFKISHFQYFVVLYIIGKMMSLIYCGYLGRKIIFAHRLPMLHTVREMFTNISIGIKLMLSNIAGMLILGVGRFIIDGKWGIETFGRFSFALSLTNFFLLFVSQISMVLFPAMRRANRSSLRMIYITIREGIGLVLTSSLLFYFPAIFILNYWLPKYSQSFEYMVLLLPLCIFDGKMQIVCNTYLKVLRKERILLIINAITFIISIVMAELSAFILNNIYFVTLSMTISIIFRSIVSELYLNKKLQIISINSLVNEIVLSGFFVIIAWCFPLLLAFWIYFTAYIVYLILNKKKIKALLNQAKLILVK